jgi:hypothetical protein
MQFRKVGARSRHGARHRETINFNVNGGPMASTDLPILINQDQIKGIIRDVIREELARTLPNIVRQSTSKEFLTIDEVSNLTGYSKRHLQYLRDQYYVDLPYSKHGRKITYKRSDVMAFLEKNYVKARG